MIADELIKSLSLTVRGLKYESISNDQIMYKIFRRSLKSTVSADNYMITSVVTNSKTNPNYVVSQISF